MKNSTKYKKPRKLKIALLAVMGLALITVVAVYIGYRQVVSTPELLIDTLKSGADMSIGKIHQTSTRDGRLEWSLDASSAHYIQDKKAVIFKDISVIFYLKDNQKVFLKADEGTLNTDSNDIEVAGNVVIQNQDYKMATEKLNYHHEERLIVSKNRINISGTAGKIAANALEFDLNTNNVELTGDVRGFFLNNQVM